MSRKRSGMNLRAAGAARALATCWLRNAIVPPKGRRLVVLIYARYSTEEQNALSIDQQIGFCRKFLEAAGLADCELVVLSDEGISGEHVHRPGIDQVRDGIAAEKWNVILAEDSSRLFRNETACIELVGAAVDRELRVICINDYVDTAEEDWEDRLHEAQHHHSRSNTYTSRRIKRAHDALWEMGAAIGLLRPGYRRKPTHPATAREPERGLFFDEIDREWAAIVHEAYTRIAGNEPTESVAQWLTKVGLPKTANSKTPDWSDTNVISLIRRSIYRGVETRRNTVATKHYGSGKRKQKPNDPDKVQVRDMSHLRIVSDSLWHQANSAIDANCRGKNGRGCGKSSLVGVPRDSRGPLSGVFVCGVCSGADHPGKMYAGEGRTGNSYRCQHAKKNVCWNKATCERGLAHERIRDAVTDALECIRGDLGPLLSRLSEFAADERQQEERAVELRMRIDEHQHAIEKLAVAIETTDEPPEILVQRLAQREEDLAQVTAELDGLQSRVRVPTEAEIRNRIDEMKRLVAPMDRHANLVLRQMVMEIRAVPYRQFGGEKVVLRATFAVRIASVLPPAAYATLVARYGEDFGDAFGLVPCCVDLFNRSAGPKYGLKALKLSELGRGLTAIGKKLRITKRKANIAVQYGRQLRAAGLSNPFLELTEAPETASRDAAPARVLTISRAKSIYFSSR
ncbi:MAG: recombinase family protein [Planctomycetes bacterium]|nr:recombinase family protein [Planctomycetota bacterium]